MKTTYTLVVKEVGSNDSWEERDQEISEDFDGDAEEHALYIIARFNGTLKQNETARELVKIKDIKITS